MDLTLHNVGKFEMNDFLGRNLTCECGKTHRVSVSRSVIENDAIKKLPDILQEFGFRKALVIADTNTYQVAGLVVEAVLTEAHFTYKTFVFRVKDDLVPNEAAVGQIFIQVEEDTDVIVTIGSGTLNDLAKFVSHKIGISSIVVATAPSMDGFASTGAALIVNNLKTSIESASPKAIIGDVNILKKAPMAMIVAGFGDIVGKYSALSDWKLSEAINGEYYCDVNAKMVRNCMEKCINNTDGIKNREDIAIKNLMESLVVTGIAMSFVGNSRPASGSEHHLAHYWEMMFLFEGKQAVLHGTKVGIATVVMAKLHEILSNSTINFVEAIHEAKLFDQNQWRKTVVKLYPTSAQEIIGINEKEQRNSIAKRLERITLIENNLDKIMPIIKDVPSAVEIESILNKVGVPVRPKTVGIDEETLVHGILMAKEVRTRYTLLNFLWDIGLLEDLAVRVRDYFDSTPTVAEK